MGEAARGLGLFKAYCNGHLGSGRKSDVKERLYGAGDTVRDRAYHTAVGGKHIHASLVNDIALLVVGVAMYVDRGNNDINELDLLVDIVGDVLAATVDCVK